MNTIAACFDAIICFVRSQLEISMFIHGNTAMSIPFRRILSRVLPRLTKSSSEMGAKLTLRSLVVFLLFLYLE